MTSFEHSELSFFDFCIGPSLVIRMREGIRAQDVYVESRDDRTAWTPTEMLKQSRIGTKLQKA